MAALTEDDDIHMSDGGRLLILSMEGSLFMYASTHPLEEVLIHISTPEYLSSHGVRFPYDLDVEADEPSAPPTAGWWEGEEQD